jgi:hypothetical protein
MYVNDLNEKCDTDDDGRLSRMYCLVLELAEAAILKINDCTGIFSMLLLALS